MTLAISHFLRAHFLHIILTCWLTHQREYRFFYFPGLCSETAVIVSGVLFAITLLITLFIALPIIFILRNRLIKLEEQRPAEEMALSDTSILDQPDNRMA